MDAQSALNELNTGNRRFSSQITAHPHQDPLHREELIKGQAPFAVIIGCADSRIPPEIIFDQGLGDLFVIRVAGNVVTPEIVASVEYAVAHLGTKLVVVLGHDKCGAVTAAIGGNDESPALVTLMEKIKPAVEMAASVPGDQQTNVEKANVTLAVEQLKQSPTILAPALKEGLEIIGMYYQQSTGEAAVI